MRGFRALALLAFAGLIVPLSARSLADVCKCEHLKSNPPRDPCGPAHCPRSTPHKPDPHTGKGQRGQAAPPTLPPHDTCAVQLAAPRQQPTGTKAAAT